jgi:nicotinamide-nucleotide amidase
VYIGLAGPKGTVVRRINWPGQREQIRGIAAMVGLDLLRRELQGLEPLAPEWIQRRAK